MSQMRMMRMEIPMGRGLDVNLNDILFLKVVINQSFLVKDIRWGTVSSMSVPLNWGTKVFVMRDWKSSQ